MSERSITIERLHRGYVVVTSQPWSSYGRMRIVAETIEGAVEIAVLDLNSYPIGTRVEVRIVEPEKKP